MRPDTNFRSRSVYFIEGLLYIPGNSDPRVHTDYKTANSLAADLIVSRH